MDTESDNVQKACSDILKNVSKNRRYILKRDYFDKMQANEVSIKSPVKGVSDEEWQALTALWVTPRHRVCFLLQWQGIFACMLDILLIFIVCILLDIIIVPICRTHV